MPPRTPATTSPTPARPSETQIARATTAPPPNYSLASVPFMIGDAFGTSGQTLTLVAPNPIASAGIPFVTSTLKVPTGGGGAVGQSKLVEGFSPMPRDRVFFNYSYFNSVPLGTSGVDVNRYTPGFEKTFFDRWASIEFRTPFAGTLNSTINANGSLDTNHGEFGDLFTALKVLLVRNDNFAFSTGMSLTAPTARDIQVVNIPGSTLQSLRIHNDAVHLQPFASFLITPNDRGFFQGLFQVDVPTTANRVSAQFAGLPETTYGSLNNQTMCNVSLSAGYWLWQNPNSFVSGVAPLFEAHYSQTVSSANSVTGTGTPTTNAFILGDPGYQFQSLNATVGANVQMGPLTSVLLGYSTPIGSGNDQQFHGEFRMFMVRRFGPQSRLTRAQF